LFLTFILNQLQGTKLHKNPELFVNMAKENCFSYTFFHEKPTNRFPNIPIRHVELMNDLHFASGRPTQPAAPATPPSRRSQQRSNGL